ILPFAARVAFRRLCHVIPKTGCIINIVLDRCTAREVIVFSWPSGETLAHKVQTEGVFGGLQVGYGCACCCFRLDAVIHDDGDCSEDQHDRNSNHKLNKRESAFAFLHADSIEVGAEKYNRTEEGWGGCCIAAMTGVHGTARAEWRRCSQ